MSDNEASTIFGIYNADSSVLGEIRYTLGKMVGDRNCELCELTHGWNPFGKKDWKDALSTSPIRIELIHRNEADPAQFHATSSLPAFIVNSDGVWVELMNADTIAMFKGRPADLVSTLNHLLPTI